ncbi:MAG: hypothetical protein JW941_07530 [Candidatus Coatesbacteria bacterium]|nr:hypothetical protein [Candidatus Coatesbacteria bacterium]
MNRYSLRKPCFCASLIVALLVVFSSLSPAAETASISLIESTPDGFILEFESPAPDFSWQEFNGDLFEEVEISGCESIGEPGKPSLPFLGFLLAVPGDCEPSAEFICTTEEEFYGLRVAPNPRYIRMDDGGEIALEPCFELDEAQYSANAYYPDSEVEAEFFGVFRGQPLIRIIVNPLRYNPVTGTMRFIERGTIAVHIDGMGADLGLDEFGVRYSECGSSSRMLGAVRCSVENPDDVRPLLVRSADEPQPEQIALAEDKDALKIILDHDGIYKVTGSEIAAAGITLSTIVPAEISVSNMGQEIALLVQEGGDGVFDAADYFLLWGEAPDSEFTNDNVYWVNFGQSGASRMTDVDAHPTGGAQLATAFIDSPRFEVNSSYNQNIPDSEGEDHYFWGDRITAPDTIEHRFDIHNLSSEAFEATILVELRGYSDVANVNPDHHTQIFINDQLTDDQTWNGKIIFTHEITGPQSLIQAGRNELTMNCPGDLTFLDQLYFNYFEITYLATFVATAGVLEFSPRETGPTEFHIGGFSSDDIMALDITDPAVPKNLTNISISPDGGGFAVSFQDNTSPDRKYYVAQSSSFNQASDIVLDTPSSLMSSANRADYIIISHPNFIDSAEGIAQHHSAKGVVTMLVDIEDVYDEFSHGVKSPQAIKDFLTYAYENFSGPPPSDVLLVGDADIDPKYRKGTEIDYVPTHVYNDPDPNAMGETPTDNWFVCVDGSDILPDMGIGRICAKRSSDVDAVLNKIEAYDNGHATGDWRNRVLFAADNENESVNLNMELAMFYLPGEYDATHVNYKDYSTGSEANADLMANLDSGCLLVNYAGHGNINRWAQSLFSSGNVSALQNGDKMPFAITLTCLNGFFPHVDSTACMGDVLVRTAGKGAIGSLSPTGVDNASNHKILASAFYEEVFYDFNCYLGSAVMTAKVVGFARAGYAAYFDNIMQTYTLFGDPGIALAVPTAPVDPRLIVSTDKDIYYGGQTLNVDVLLENSGDTISVDAYLALDYGGTLLYYPGFGVEPAPIPVDLFPFLKLRLRAASIPVPEPSPVGTYTFYAAMTQPGDMSQFIGSVSSARFEIR